MKKPQSIKRAISRGNMRYNIVMIGDRPTFIDLEKKSKRGNGWFLVQRFNFDPSILNP